MPQNSKYVIGVDLGGTKIYSTVVDMAGNIQASARKKTKAELGFDVVVGRIAKCIKEAADRGGIDLDTDIATIGIGSPGPLDLDKGMIIETPNLKWKDAPLKARLEEILHKKVVIDNDCNAGILGEFAYGAGHGAQHMVGLFIGTGIGGGVIIDGKLLHGYNQNAGELGHVILDPNGPECGCGVNGHLEAFASRLAIEREIRVAELHGVQTAVLQNGEKTVRIRSKKIAEAFFAGDAAVIAAVEKSALYVGYAVANFLNIFNPQVVVIGGGVVEAIGEPYVKIVRNTATKNVFDIARRNVQIVKAELGDNSAALGAAVLAWNAVANEKLL
ncbi:ROK family protein [candidate division KSB1 bacterium]|nr:ROK family protein [candidate division KSB1 bacterium]RQW05993.1 MAG: ROK family protein [candidate division KSB1 bacterium]